MREQSGYLTMPLKGPFGVVGEQEVVEESAVALGTAVQEYIAGFLQSLELERFVCPRGHFLIRHIAVQDRRRR